MLNAARDKIKLLGFCNDKYSYHYCWWKKLFW